MDQERDLPYGDENRNGLSIRRRNNPERPMRKPGTYAACKAREKFQLGIKKHHISIETSIDKKLVIIMNANKQAAILIKVQGKKIE